MTPSSIISIAKSIAANAASVADYIKYGFENKDGTQFPKIDPKHSASTPPLWSSIM
jgi:hypothetical protein